MTIQNLGTKTEVLNFLPNDVVATTVTASTAIDLVDYEGDIQWCFVLKLAALALPTLAS